MLFALLGVMAYDGVNVVVANVGAADDAVTAAREASDVLRSTRDVQAAYDAAVATLDSDDATIETETFLAGADGAVDLVVVRHPDTLWLQRLGPLSRFAVVRQGAHASPAG